MSKTAVIAIGGNALTREGQRGTYAEQQANAQPMAEMIAALGATGWNVVLVHGNGPQIGNLAIQHERTEEVPAMPLFCLGSMTEGQIGTLLTLTLRTEIGAALPPVACLITHAVVDRADPAFDHPDKPIGPFFDIATGTRLAEANGWTIAEDAGRGYRRVVGSPVPVDFLEIDAIRTLVAAGQVVIAAGGGGVPVIKDGNGYRGVNAVVDKDRSAQRLATLLGAEVLVLATAVPKVAIDFGTPREHALTELTVAEANRHLADGQFPAGSMGPKMRAAIDFVAAGGRCAVITTAERVAATLSRQPHAEHETGTRIVATPDRTGAIR